MKRVFVCCVMALLLCSCQNNKAKVSIKQIGMECDEYYAKVTIQIACPEPVEIRRLTRLSVRPSNYSGYAFGDVNYVIIRETERSAILQYEVYNTVPIIGKTEQVLIENIITDTEEIIGQWSIEVRYEKTADTVTLVHADHNDAFPFSLDTVQVSPYSVHIAGIGSPYPDMADDIRIVLNSGAIFKCRGGMTQNLTDDNHVSSFCGTYPFHNSIELKDVAYMLINDFRAELEPAGGKTQ